MSINIYLQADFPLAIQNKAQLYDCGINADRQDETDWTLPRDRDRQFGT